MRLDAQLSQEALAQKIGVAVSTIRRWEKGLAEPTMTVVQLKGFLNAVNVNFQELPDSLLPVN
ncbi:helix-turn-helix transcriptional regulator [Okeania sp. SIO2B9]|uniref:helix-turn-helix domain-containing protein n=1 Tax=Okeania sp. SIO2B9 TaxID=2607782 RepID=UPI00257C343D|nr:helix-turn-helix transcriptional regulator [Okeania sp. SIO2B9]